VCWSLVVSGGQKLQRKPFFSEVPCCLVRNMATFKYPQVRRDETVVEDYHATKVIINLCFGTVRAWYGSGSLDQFTEITDPAYICLVTIVIPAITI
jgi:hypothetical protein